MRINKKLFTMITLLLVTMLFTSCSNSKSPKDTQSAILEDNMFVNDVLLANDDGRWSLINKQGEELANYNYIDPIYSDGLLKVEEDDMYGFIDCTGKVVIPLQYDNAAAFSEGMAAVYINSQWGFIDKTNKMVIMPQYDRPSTFISGLCAVSKNDVYSYINKDGKQAFEGEFLYADAFAYGSGVIETEDGMALINKEGEIISDIYFDDISYDDFSTLVNLGYAMITIDDSYGYINKKTGDVVLYPMYYNVSGYYDGLCSVSLDSGVGLVDDKGSIILNPTYEKIQIIKNGIAIAYDENNNVTFFDKTGKEIDASKIKDGYITMQYLEDGINKKLVTHTGEVILEGNILGFIPISTYEYLYIIVDPSKDEPSYTTTIIDNKGNKIVELDGRYGIVLHTSENEYIASNSEENWILLDSKGNTKASLSDTNLILRNDDSSYVIRYKNQLSYVHSGPYERNNPYYHLVNSIYFTDDGYALIGYPSSFYNDKYVNGDDGDITQNYEIGVGVINKDGETIISEKYNTICSLFDINSIMKLINN